MPRSAIGVTSGSFRRELGQQFQRETPASQPVLDAAQHQRTAVLPLQPHDLVERQPVRRQDAVVELPQRIVRETVREAARVTRPGGVFAIYDFNPSNTMSPFQLHHRDFDAAHNGEPYSQDFCDCDLDAILAEHGFSVAASPLAKRSGGVGYMKHWFATRG